MYKNIIIIPYREREQHLEYFIKHSVPLIEECMPETKVVVVEQSVDKLFNRGKLLNVGFKEYMDKTEYFITHDVDINPKKETLDYYNINIENGIVRLLSAHESSLGGVVKFHNESINKSNGFPNNIWGWGIEDRALFNRCIIKNINIKDTSLSKKNFVILHHKSNVETYFGEKLKISEKWTKKYIDKLEEKDKLKMITEDGINTVEYKIIERKELHKIVELIKVEI